VVAPPPTPTRAVQTRGQQSGGLTGEDYGLEGNLPGMAGMNLPMNIKPEDLGLSQEELLQMLQQQGRQ